MQRSMPFLWGLVIILLILNLVLLYGLNRTRLTVIETLGEVEITLDNLANEVIVYNIEVSQPVPIKADVPLKQTMEIPLNTVIPIDQELTVPFQTGNSEIEIDMPFKIDFPLDIVVPVDFDQIINIDTVVELNTTVPVEIEIGKTPLAGYLEQARADIVRLRNTFSFQAESPIIQDTVVYAVSNNETNTDVTATVVDNPLATVVATETVAKAELVSPELLAESSDSSSANEVAISTDAELQSNNTDIQFDLGWCTHTYWPLWPDTTWLYNSVDTSFIQRVDNVLNNQVFLSAQQYEGQGIQFSLVCYQEGLGGSYLGDMRRITELGNLNFSNSHGMFLPRPEVMEEIGNSWTQEFDVTGIIEAYQGNKLLEGNISQGRAVAVYTSTGFETLETPLGPREALGIEQKLNIKLDIDFELNDQTIAATEIVNLTTVQWFVKGIGPVKTHWQGGAIQQEFEVENALVLQESTVSTLAEDELVMVCVSVEESSPECLRIVDVSSSDLTAPSEVELDIEGFSFPANIGVGKDGMADEVDDIDNVETISPGNPLEAVTNTTELLLIELPDADNDQQSALLQYAEAAANLGEKIVKTGEEFGNSALAYRDNKITLAEFKDKFSSFKPKIKDLIQRVNALSPPLEVEQIHRKLSSGLNKCNQGVDLMDEWFDTHDSSTRDATALLVANCINQVTTASEELKQLIP